MFYILIAILTGFLIVLSRIISFKLSNEIGIFQSTLFNYIVGTLCSFVLIFLLNINIDLSKFSPIPYWAYLGGFIGVFIVMLSIYITPKISAFYLTLFIFIGQLFIGIIIDYISTKNISIGKMIGSILVVIGLAYNLQIDKKTQK